MRPLLSSSIVPFIGLCFLMCTTLLGCSDGDEVKPGSSEVGVDAGSILDTSGITEDTAPDPGATAPETTEADTTVEPTDVAVGPDPTKDADDPLEVVETDVDVPSADVPVTEPDVVEPPPEDVVSDDCAAYPIPDYCACEQSDDCASGFCLPTSAGKQCAETCESECPDGFSCSAVGSGGDPIYVCVERTLNLCKPCESGADCVVTGFEGEDQCVSYGDAGSFCGVACVDNDGCPSGYACQSGQCALQEGECSCAPIHQTLGAQTTCSSTTEFGTCGGLRFCDADGLSACDAAVPASEICDGVDNDCNGVIDDLTDTSCQLENQFGACPGTIVCLGGGAVCQGDPPSPEVCDGLDNDCNGEADEGYSNSDGDALSDCVDPDDDNDDFPDDIDNCPKQANDQLDTDSDGLGDACDPDDDNDGSADDVDCAPLLAFAYPFAPEVCDGVDNDCDDNVDESTCDDGDLCTDDVCSPIDGCQHTFNTAPCNDGNPCTDSDACNLGFCEGAFGACDDGNPCTTDQCTKDAGCTHIVLTGPCDDGNACTTGDTCGAGGQCYGQPVFCDDDSGCTTDSCDPIQGCVYEANDAPCDDGTVCTTGDECVEGVCQGTPLGCEDDNPCTDDTCDAVLGCSFVHNDEPCSDDDTCTLFDQCSGGQCVGEPVDCSPLDGPCQVGVCQNGGCIAEEYTCQMTTVRMQISGGNVDGKSPGGYRLRGSVGQPGPSGQSQGGDGYHSIRFGFTPRF